MASVARLRLIEGGLEPRVAFAAAPDVARPDPADRFPPRYSTSRPALLFALAVSLALHGGIFAWSMMRNVDDEALAEGGSSEEIVIEGISLVLLDSAASTASLPEAELTPEDSVAVTVVETVPMQPPAEATVLATDTAPVVEDTNTTPSDVAVDVATAMDLPDAAPVPDAVPVDVMPTQVPDVAAEAIVPMPVPVETVRQAQEVAIAAVADAARATLAETAAAAAVEETAVRQVADSATPAAQDARPARPVEVAAAEPLADTATTEAAAQLVTPEAAASVVTERSEAAVPVDDAVAPQTETEARPANADTVPETVVADASTVVTDMAARALDDAAPAAAASDTAVPVTELPPEPPMPTLRPETAKLPDVPPPPPTPPAPQKPAAAKPPPKAKPAPAAPTKPAPARQQSTPSASQQAAAGPKPGDAGAGGASREERGGASLSSYQSKVAARLRRFRSYPEAARAQALRGTASVTFTIVASGAVGKVSLSGSSGHKVLDQAALDMVRRAAPFPPIPNGLGNSVTISVPIRFDLN